MSKFRSWKVRSALYAAIIILVLVFSAAYYAKIDLFRNPTTSESSQTLLNSTTSQSSYSSTSQISITTLTYYTFTTYYSFPIYVNYSGSWRLVYWGTNGTMTPDNYTNYNVRGNLTGSGNYEKTIATYGVGYELNTLCANATKLGTENNLTLSLTVLVKNESTTAFNQSVEVCVSMGA